ncbi:MAG: hypothetical protein ACYC06_08635, partial [Ilumatobacteraceae bacterium]
MRVRIGAGPSTMRRLAFICATVVFLPACGTLDFLTGNNGFVDGVGRLTGGDFDTLVSLPP